MCDADAVTRHQLNLFRVDMHTMRRNQRLLQQAVLLQPAHGPQGRLGNQRLGLVERLCHMDKLRHAISGSDLSRCLQQLWRGHIDRVGSGHRDDQIMSTPVPDKVLAVSQPLFIAGSIGRRVLDDGLTTDGTHTSLCCRPGYLLLKVIHVHKTSRSTAQHLCASERGAQEAKLGGDKSALHWQDIAVQPHIQAQVIGQPAQQGHGRVRVRVDKARQDKVVLAVNRLRRVIASR